MVKRALFTSFPIVAALQEADAFIANVLWEERGVRPEEPLQWIADNDVQTALIGPRIWDPTLAALAGFAEGEMSSVASWDVEVINTFLRREEFEIQLRPWLKGDRLTFGIAAIIKLLREWCVRGETGYKVVNWRKAFRLGAPVAQGGVEFYRASGEVVVRIPTKVHGDCVCVTKASEPKTHFDLLFFCMDAQDAMEPTDEFTGAILPNWSFQEEVDVSDLINLWTEDAVGQPWWLAQALMEGKSAFCAEGISFKAAFAAAVMRGGSWPKEPEPRDHIVDYNLVMWIDREGVPVPLGAVYVETDEFSQTDVHLE